MGRRSINTTKSGKYMNPTDQARKEARKKELKKNKRQRQMVRAAVLKMKDPTQILEELQKIDEMEYNVLQPSPLNEKVLKEKRKKLKETFDRVLKMYDKDEPEKWVELKRQESEYEKKRVHLISYYESVRHAQSVLVDDIPLPSLQPSENILYGNLPLQIPLPMDPGQAAVPKPILKKDTAYAERPAGLEPPGVPPGPPPNYDEILQIKTSTKFPIKVRFDVPISDDGPPGDDAPIVAPPIQHPPPMERQGNDAMDQDEPIAPPLPAVAPKPTSLQQRMLALSGQNIDEFMKEMEEVHKKRERDRAADLNARLTALKRTDRRDSDSDSDGELPPPRHPAAGIEPPPLVPGTAPPQPLPPPGTRPAAPPMLPPVFMMGVGRPPGPPPGPPRLLRPPGPPPGAPPRLLRPPGPPPMLRVPAPLSVLTAAPQLIPKKDGGATISAKPQIRNLSADVTRFVPSALRVKREDKKAKAPLKTTVQRPADVPKQAPTKDDAYMQFMKEMQGLL